MDERHHRGTDDRRHFVTLHHLVGADGEATVREVDKAEAWEWFNLDELPSPMFGPSGALFAGG